MAINKALGEEKWSRLFGNAFWLLSFDCLVFFCALLLGNFILLHVKGIPPSIQYSMMILPVWCVGALLTGIAPGWGLGAVEEFRRVQLLLMAVFALAGIAVFMTRGMPSRIVFLSTYLFSAFCLPFGRMLCRKLLRGFKKWGCGVAIYGDNETVDHLLEVLQQEVAIGYYPYGIFSDELECGSEQRGVPVLGKMNDSTTSVSVAVASIAQLHDRNLVKFVDQILAGYHKVVLLPNITKGVFSWVVPRDFNGLVGLEISRNLLIPLSSFVKRFYELFLVLLFLPVWLPLVMLLSLLVYLSDFRNPFYAQERVGRNGKLFKALKLRTMVPCADQVLEELLNEDAEKQEEWSRFYKLKQDPRITPIGKFLRIFSLDEFPQLMNVLKGDMALVGPRPLPVYHQSELSEESRLIRARVRPGLTGQWQISGRSDCQLEEMELWDNYYVRNWSIWMDVYIMARTLRVILFSHGAY